jgi:hypothetical protein
MCRSICLRYLIPAICGVGLLMPIASAGWVCIKNECQVALVIQDVPARTKLKRGKVVKLLPGEVYREHQTAAGEGQVQVYDARYPAKPLCRTKLTWPAKGDVTYKLEVVEQEVRLSLLVPDKSTTPSVGQAGSPKR